MNQCKPLLIGNGDIFSYHDYAKNVEGTGVATCMVARGALIKPWVGLHRHCSPQVLGLRV